MDEIDKNYNLQPGETNDAYKARVDVYNSNKRQPGAATGFTEPKSGGSALGTYSTGAPKTNAVDPKTGQAVVVGDPSLNPQFNYTSTTTGTPTGGTPATNTGTAPSTTGSGTYTEPAPVAPKSEEDLYAEKRRFAQAEIDNLNKYYDDEVARQGVINAGRDRSTNAISVLTGLSGSTEANVEAGKTTDRNQADNRRIQNERALAIGQVLTGIRTSATAEARQARLDARQDTQDAIARRAKNREESIQNLTLLAGAGTTLDGLKATDPNSYNFLVQSVGGENIAKAILFAGRAKNTLVGKPEVLGGQLFQAYQTPDGSVKYESVALPEGVKPDNIQSVEKTDAGIFIINKDGTWTTVTGSAKPKPTGDGTTITGVNADLYKGALDTILGSGRFTKDQKASIVNSISNGEDPATVVRNNAKNIMGATTAKEVTDNENALASMLSVQNALKDYYALGGKTNIFKGKLDDVARRLGTTTDPALVEVAVQLEAAIQSYRKAITGTAYSAQEGYDIGAIFPGIDKNEGLNDAIIRGRVKTFQSAIDSGYRNILGSAYDKLQESERKASETKATADPYADFRKDLKQNEILIQRGDKVLAITVGEFKPGDINL